MVKNLPAMWETWVQSLSQVDPLEKGTVTYSCIFFWRIPWTEEPGGLQSMRLQRDGHNRAIFKFQEEAAKKKKKKRTRIRTNKAQTGRFDFQ